MKKSLLLLAALLLTAGCASTSEPPPATAPLVATPDPSPFNERGNQVAQFGDPVVIMSPESDQPLVTFTLGTPTAFPQCDDPRNGPYFPDSKFIQMPLNVETSADPQGVLSRVNLMMDWEYVAPDGTSVQASTGSSRACHWEGGQELRPSRKYDYSAFLLEVPNASAGGYIILHTAGGNNWEWQLPI